MNGITIIFSFVNIIGKGSVTTKIAKSLQADGYRVGLYTSPHIFSFRERIQMNDELISEEQVEKLLPPILDACEKNDIAATFFEVTTLLAFAHFALSKVDFVSVEVGMGYFFLFFLFLDLFDYYISTYSRC